MSVETELRKIRVKHGKLTPRIVLEEGRDPTHPLHDRFEWDDAVAADAHRLRQARDLIVQVKFRFEDSPEDQPPLRRYYALRASDADEYDYDDVEEVMRDPFRRKLLLNEMRRRMDELERQYGAMQEFWQTIRRMARKRKSASV